jgi:hypothetical protein
MEMIQPIRLRLHLDSRSMPTQQVMSLVFFLGIGVWQCGGVVCVSVSVDVGPEEGVFHCAYQPFFFISNLFLSKIT